MRIYPFTAGSFKNILVFNAKDRYMLLKQFKLDDIQDCDTIIDSMEGTLDSIREKVYCLEIGFSIGQINQILSINLVADEKNHDFSEINILLENIGKNQVWEGQDYVNHFKNTYLSLFKDQENPAFRFKEKYLHVLDPRSKKVQKYLAAYKVNLYNADLNHVFLDIIKDIGLRVKMDVKLFLFIEKRVAGVELACFVILGKGKKKKLNQMMEKLEKINDSSIILTKVKFTRKLLGSLMLRRAITNEVMHEYDSVSQFFKKHFFSKITSKGDRDTENTTKSKKQDIMEKSGDEDAKLVIREEIKEIPEKKDNENEIKEQNFLINERVVQEHHKIAFLNQISQLGNSKIIDNQSCIIDDGRNIYFLIRGLNITNLNAIIRKYKRARKYLLIFINESEKNDFLEYMPGKMADIYEVSTLDAFLEQYSTVLV